MLIVASMREWQTFVRTAGCDVYTVPAGVIQGFFDQQEFSPQGIKSSLECSYQDQLGIDSEVMDILPLERISRLWKVEPELIEFLTEFRVTREYSEMYDGDALYKRFDDAGFGGIFHSPSESEWIEIRKSKLPDLQSDLPKQIPLDTLYSLLADADFEKYQEEIDKKIEEGLSE
jgi:transaldolase